MSNVTIQKKGHSINVVKDGEVIKSFCEISDDYAHTNAKNYANKLRQKKTVNDLSIGTIRNAQSLCEETCKNIGEWKAFWRKFAIDNNVTEKDALSLAQDRF